MSAPPPAAAAAAAAAVPLGVTLLVTLSALLNFRPHTHIHTPHSSPAHGLCPQGSSCSLSHALKLCFPNTHTSKQSPFIPPRCQLQLHTAVLVHCGAGVSRSATLVMMYLMRRNSWSAARARGYVVERRSVVCINDGFYMTLCALEPQLGIAER